MIDFSGKTIIVTGAAAGIGAACAESFIAAGANVVIADIDEEASQAIVARLGQKSLAIRCNVANEVDCAKRNDP